MFGAVVKFIRLNAGDRRLLLCAAVRLLRAGTRLWRSPFWSVAATLGKSGYQTERRLSVEDVAYVSRVEKAFARLHRRMPLFRRCLVRTIAAQDMLKNRDIPSTLYLGMKKRSDGAGMEAHAWLRCGERIIIGAPDHEDYTVVAWFGWEPS